MPVHPDGADDPAARPNRVPWPPLIYAAALVGGLTLQWLAPLGWLAAMSGAAMSGAAMSGAVMSGAVMWGPAVRIAGIAIAGAGLAFDLSALATLHRVRTNILPHRAADRLVTHGPFALSRHPIYLGNTLFLLGIGLVLLNPWLVMAALLAVLATDRLAARREERHLAAKFGPAFAAYAARVPRWIGLPRRATPPPPPGPGRS